VKGGGGDWEERRRRIRGEGINSDPPVLSSDPLSQESGPYIAGMIITSNKNSKNDNQNRVRRVRNRSNRQEQAQAAGTTPRVGSLGERKSFWIFTARHSGGAGRDPDAKGSRGKGRGIVRIADLSPGSPPLRSLYPGRFDRTRPRRRQPCRRRLSFDRLETIYLPFHRYPSLLGRARTPHAGRAGLPRCRGRAPWLRIVYFALVYRSKDSSGKSFIFCSSRYVSATDEGPLPTIEGDAHAREPKGTFCYKFYFILLSVLRHRSGRFCPILRRSFRLGNPVPADRAAAREGGPALPHRMANPTTRNKLEIPAFWKS
jgi:hypothetical protein